MMNVNEVQCPEHGVREATFVCQHLAACLKTGKVVGLFTAEDPTNPRPDAWCKVCDEFCYHHGGDWNDETEVFAGITMICSECYDQAKQINSQL